MPGFIGKNKQRIFDTFKLISKIRPALLLPIIPHEPNIAIIRLKKKQIVSRLALLFGSYSNLKEPYATASTTQLTF